MALQDLLPPLPALPPPPLPPHSYPPPGSLLLLDGDAVAYYYAYYGFETAQCSLLAYYGLKQLLAGWLQPNLPNPASVNIICTFFGHCAARADLLATKAASTCLPPSSPHPPPPPPQPPMWAYALPSEGASGAVIGG